jgi:hypothetical protein
VRQKEAPRHLAKAYDLPRPDRLVYRAFSRAGHEILLPHLGLDRAPTPGEGPTVGERVDATLRRWLDVDEVAYDDDGDAPIRCGGAMSFVRTVTDPPMVVVFAPMLRGIDTSSPLLEAINDMNADVRFARALATGTTLMVAAEVDTGPGMEAALVRACDAVGWIADHWGPRLQERFGGTTFFQDSSPAMPPTGSVGGYL